MGNSMPPSGASGRFRPVIEIPCYHVDAFTERRFSGNPAAVCPLASWLPDALMQQIAAENALPETAFFAPRPGGDDFDLRWFTPAVEVDLCGHATLAAGFVLLRALEPAREQVRFWTQSGPLVVARRGDALSLDLPARPPVPCDMPEGLPAALGAAPLECLRSRDLVAVYGSAAEVRALRPDFAAISALPTFGLVATAPGGPPDADVDFVSRFFAPLQGIPEDPVTGSAHCTLSPLWSARLGRPTLRARQVGPRSGDLTCTLAGDRVHLAGHAVLVKSGPLYLD